MNYLVVEIGLTWMSFRRAKLLIYSISTYLHLLTFINNSPRSKALAIKASIYL